MKVKFRTAELGGVERRFIFNTQALDEVMEKYGSLKEFYDTFGLLPDDKEDEAKRSKAKKKKNKRAIIKEYAWIIALLINQGIEIDNLEKGTDTPLITEKAVVLYMEPYEFGAVKDAVIGAIFDGMLSEKAREKAQNEDEVLAEIKNGQGAAMG